MAITRTQNCPGCGNGFYARIIIQGGYPATFYDPGEAPEITEVEEIVRDCEEECTVTDAELETLALETGEIDYDDLVDFPEPD